MAGTLYVVATPIGHLDDITARALRILQQVAVVAAEDTRRSGNLLRHFGIPTKLVSLHAHNEHTRGPELVRQLLAGVSVAVVSDAGTPGISDPGAELVRLARAAGVRIDPVPGPSAVAAAVSVAGLGDTRFAFMGFPPTRSKDRKQWFVDMDQTRRLMPVVFFEAPHRVRQCLGELSNSVKQPIQVFRELTKLHEEALEGTPEQLVERIQAPQGEFTVVLPRQETSAEEQVTASAADLKTEVGRITENGASSRRDAARQVAQRYGLSTKYVYDITRD
jgi:16S rRNA (cytidine1402-2'-O)-methyltransferase